MIIVLDGSGAMEILFQRTKSDVFAKAYSEGTWIIAPDLFIAEITNILWKYFRSRLITHEDCIQYTQDGLDLIDDFIDTKKLWKEALSEGMKNNHPIYDMYYAVLARRNNGLLISNDKALTEICTKLNIRVCN